MTSSEESGESLGGVRATVGRVVEHATAVARLEKELARAELERRGGIVGAGAGAALAAAIFALYAVGFGLALVAVLLALVVDWWLSLLVVFLLLVILVIGLLLAARSLFETGMPLKPQQAIEEARLTKQVLRNAGAR